MAEHVRTVVEYTCDSCKKDIKTRDEPYVDFIKPVEEMAHFHEGCFIKLSAYDFAKILGLHGSHRFPNSWDDRKYFDRELFMSGPMKKMIKDYKENGN